MSQTRSLDLELQIARCAGHLGVPPQVLADVMILLLREAYDRGMASRGGDPLVESKDLAALREILSELLVDGGGAP